MLMQLDPSAIQYCTFTMLSLAPNELVGTYENPLLPGLSLKTITAQTQKYEFPENTFNIRSGALCIVTASQA
jgi:hypothetical protein